MELQILSADDSDEVMELFLTCFADDEYYSKVFVHSETRLNDLKEVSLPSITYCIEQGYCLGVRCDGKLIAFSLCFDYRKTKVSHPEMFVQIFGGNISNGRMTLPYMHSLHQTVSVTGDKILFLLSIAVDPRYRSMKIASGLIDMIMSTHTEYSIVSDVSNRYSLKIYEERNFTIMEIDEDYFLVSHKADDPDHSFCAGDTVKLAVPDISDLRRWELSFVPVKDKCVIPGVRSEQKYGLSYFVQDLQQTAFCTLIEMTYEEYLKYQRIINVSHYNECFSGDYTYYVLTVQYENPLLKNDLLNDMILSRKSEWAVIPDFYVSVPMQYTDISLITKAAPAYDTKTSDLLRDLDFRTHYEAGVPSEYDKVDDLAGFKNRIKRYYLGKVKVQITSEITVFHYDGIGDDIGEPACVDLYISVDIDSDCAVLTWFSLSAPFLISHLMDNIIRNQLFIVCDGKKVNIFDYLNSSYGMIKKGTPKIFVVIPKEKSCLAPNQIASLLASETIYPEGEELGVIIDSEILEAVCSDRGMGQYDRAFVCAYSNVILQFTPDLKASLRERMCEEAITLFYIELILLEEASINIADRAIINLLSSDSISDPIDFLQEVEKIHDNYSKTIDFWDIQVNYPTSKKSIDMLRKAFKIKEQFEYMQRNKNHLQTVFDAKCDIIDRKEAKRMNTSLAILSILAVFSAWIDGYDYISTWGDVFSASAIHILQRILFIVILLTAAYAVTHLFGSRFLLSVRSRIIKCGHNLKKRKRGKKETGQMHND